MVTYMNILGSISPRLAGRASCPQGVSQSKQRHARQSISVYCPQRQDSIQRMTRGRQLLMTLDYNKYLHTLLHLKDTHYIQVRVIHSFHCLPWLSSVVSVIFLLLVSFFLSCPWRWADAPLPPASWRFYPTPVLPPTGCPLFPPFPTLSQVKIFGWFFVLPSPLLLMVS